MLRAKNNRAIRRKDYFQLLIKAGGQCSFNENGLFCTKQIVSGNTNLAEVAHIVGINGPRSNDCITCEINEYANLILLCRDHHKIIDDRSNLNKYTTAYLLNMKQCHESMIFNRKQLPVMDVSNHDNQILIDIFSYIDINTLYTSISTQKISNTFRENYDLLLIYLDENSYLFPFADNFLHQKFLNFVNSQTDIMNFYVSNYNNARHFDEYSTFPQSDTFETLVYNYLSLTTDLINFFQVRFPYILKVPVYQPVINS